MRVAALQKPCAMFHQSLRHSVSPTFRSALARTQPAARSYHGHSFGRPPRPHSHRCLRRVPIQATAALLQLCQPCQCSHPSSRSFHTTQKVQGYPLIGLLAVTFKVSLQLSCIGTILKLSLFGPSSLLLFSRSFEPLAVLHLHLSQSF